MINCPSYPLKATLCNWLDEEDRPVTVITPATPVRGSQSVLKVPRSVLETRPGKAREMIVSSIKPFEAEDGLTWLFWLSAETRGQVDLAALLA